MDLDKKTPLEKCIWLVFTAGDVWLEDAECEIKAHAICAKSEMQGNG